MQSDSQRIIEKILNSGLRDDTLIQQNQPMTDTQDSVEMVIELGNDRSATIKIHADDDPEILAKAFCFQYSIDPRVINTLTNNIRNIKNTQFPNYNQKKSKISPFSDKQNNPSFINMSHQSINDSFNHKHMSNSKGKMLDRSSMVKKNDSTLISNGDWSRQSVFDRLYKDSRKKKTTKNCVDETNKKNKLSNSYLQSSNVNVDPCLAIYEKNTKAYQSSLLRRQQLHHLKQSKLVEQCTFKPEINDISEIIAKKMPHQYRSEKNRDRDIKRIQKYLEEKQRKQLQECTFEPKILEKSRSRSKSAERYKVLYEDSKLRQLKRKRSEEMLEKSRKKSGVKINKISECIVGDKPFFQRLKQDQQRRSQNKRNLQHEVCIQSNRNPSTGRAPNFHRPHNISIGEHLYNQARNKSSQKQHISHTTKLTCKKSQQIYENSKKTAFEYIFALLDSNEDGLISNTKIQLTRLNGDVLKLLAPLLIQMQQMNAQLDEQQFIEALDKLFMSFSIADKQKIINVFKFKNKNDQEQPSFKPSLNENSLMWAKSNRPQNVDLYELWKQTEAQKQQRLQQIRAYKLLSQLEQCTFHPLLFR